MVVRGTIVVLLFASAKIRTIDRRRSVIMSMIIFLRIMISFFRAPQPGYNNNRMMENNSIVFKG
jgi:hypothetical protein